MSPVLLIGSILAVLALVAMTRVLRLGGGAIDGEEEARRIAADALPGFVPEEAFVSTDGRGALVFGGTGAALIKQHGTQPAVRHVARPFRAEAIADGVQVDSGDRMFGPLRLALPPEERDKLLTLL